MESITFTCETITPMFMGGADGVAPELRAPSIKGALRFWWRAMNGHLGLAELKKREGEVFGDTKGRSCFTLRISDIDVEFGQARSVPHKNYTTKCIMPGGNFKVILSMTGKSAVWDMNKCKALFELTCLIGDFGKRARRGMGSVRITACSEKGWTETEASLEYIHQLLQQFSGHYVLQNGSIYNSFSGKMELYPWIKQIQMGRSDVNILYKISDTTHYLHGHRDAQYAYAPSLGHASGGRFASPIYVSTVFGSIKPVITTLNTVPDKGRNQIDATLQEEFKNRILG